MSEDDSFAAWPVIAFGIGKDPNDAAKVALLAETVHGMVGLEFDREQAAALARDLFGATSTLAGKQ